MSKPIVAYVLAGAIAIGSSSHAQASENQGITYDCDTADNHYSELVLPANADNFTVTGNVRLMRAGDAKKYVPLARLNVAEASQQPGSSPKGWAGFKFMALPSKKNKNEIIQLLSPDAGAAKGEAEETTDMWLPKTSVIPFELSYDGEQVKLNIDGNMKLLELHVETPVVRIVCSTGEFLFTDLTISPAS